VWVFAYSILDEIGKTPLIRLRKINRKRKVKIFAKLEMFNPSGSIKDRIAKYITEKAERRGFLKNRIIVEPTTGNTGISLAFVSAIKGYKFIAVMPEFVSSERRKIIEAYGGKVVLVPKEKGVEGVVKKAKFLAKKLKAYLPNQFENPWNVEAHMKTTGREIVESLKRIDYFVAGVGTGGTLIGVARALKKKFEKVSIIAVEPFESAVLSGGKPGFHRIEGIGEGFVPKIVEENFELIDGIIRVRERDAFKTSKILMKKEGIFAGVSSGANVYASLLIAKKIKEGTIVTVLPDSADRYFSTKLFK